jgi:serine phosphatase RsbU (regulator of sigma subunit)
MATPALADINEKLHLIQGSLLGCYFIGSSPASWLYLAGADVQPRHACLLRIGDRVRVQKHAEDSAITVFSKKRQRREIVQYPTYLEDGDILQIGGSRFTFRADTSRLERHFFPVKKGDVKEIEAAKLPALALQKIKSLLPEGALAHDPAVFGKQLLQKLVATTNARSGILFLKQEKDKDAPDQEDFEPLAMHTESSSRKIQMPENFFSQIVAADLPKLFEVMGYTGNKTQSADRLRLCYLYQPIFLATQLLGAILLIGDISARDSFRQYFPLLGDLAGNYVAPFLTLLEQKKDMEAALEEAQKIQFSMLPVGTSPQFLELASPVSLEFAGLYRPASQVAGDYLDVFFAQQNQLYFCLGDVAGKGPAAGLVMATVRAYLKLLVPRFVRTDDIINHINKNLAQDLQKMGGKFMSMVMFRWDETNRKLYYTPAGEEHFQILGQDGVIRSQQIRGTVLGLMANTQYKETELALDEGDTLVVATDGVWEAHNREGTMWERDNFYASIKKGQGRNVCDMLRIIGDGLEKFTAGVEKPHDDVTLLVVQKKSAPVVSINK